MVSQHDVLDPHNHRFMDWRWIGFLLLSLVVFHFTTPFWFEWPMLVHTGTLEGSVSSAIATDIRGNLKRQVIFFSAALVALLVLARTRNRFQMNGLLSWCVVLYLLLGLSSMAWSINVFFTAKRIVITLILWCVAVVMAARMSIREIAAYGAGLTGLTLLIGFGNELHYGTFAPLSPHWRFAGILHYVSMGWNCGLLLLCSMFMVRNEKIPWRRYFFIFLALVAFVFMYWSRTRGAVLGALVAAGYYWFRMSSDRGRWLVILACIIALAGSYVAIGDRAIDIGQNATTLGRGESGQASVANLTGRIPLWRYSFQYALDRPFVGYGYSTFVNPQTKLKILRDLGWAPNSLHSSYMDALLGTGFLGLGLLLGIMVLALEKAFRLSRINSDYDFVFAVLLWNGIISLTEGGLLAGASVMFFIPVVFIARLAFLPDREWR